MSDLIIRMGDFNGHVGRNIYRFQGVHRGFSIGEGKDGTLYLNEMDRSKLWIAHMSKIMNEENEWDQIADADAVEGPIERVMREEIMEAFKYLKIGKATGPTEVHAEMILAC